MRTGHLDEGTGTFFVYCGLMDPKAMAARGLAPRRMRPATLRHWKLTFTPRPDCHPAPGRRVEGFVADVAADTLHGLYAADGYRPRQVTVDTTDDSVDATVYLRGAPRVPPRPEDVRGLLETCWRLGMPKRYAKSIEAEAALLHAAERGSVSPAPDP